ncbi:hypothetical protein OOU_Y34scaffold00181g3 [Pyricularia oryzae Y34]|uniref:Uncharacterized protein n=2 Tax=Pyricularia oryzae TaxID=318829 RepID=A0AA97P7A0_PYRO3|nr:hypothetical protein OOU_Y34scaffold00181g3 [Pyricularia oryzae Y34]
MNGGSMCSLISIAEPFIPMISGSNLWKVTESIVIGRLTSSQTARLQLLIDTLAAAGSLVWNKLEKPNRQNLEALDGRTLKASNGRQVINIIAAPARTGPNTNSPTARSKAASWSTSTKCAARTPKCLSESTI